MRVNRSELTAMDIVTSPQHFQAHPHQTRKKKQHQQLKSTGPETKFKTQFSIY